MDYAYNYDNIQFVIETKENDKKETMRRMHRYYKIRFWVGMAEKFCKEKNKICIKQKKSTIFWEKESSLEQKIYGVLVKWKTRHPIMGIVLCTILGSILLSLVTEIIIDAIFVMC